MTSLLNSYGPVSSYIFILISVGLLFYGADWLVRGGAQIARRFGVRPLVVGLTIVAFGTSLPEFVVSFFAAMQGSSTIAIGNIIGSNITNIGLILGLSALVFPIVVSFRTMYRQLAVMIAVVILLYLFALDGIVSRWQGIFMVMILLGYIYYLYNHPDEAVVEPVDEVSDNLLKSIALVIFGIFGLMLGSRLFVDSAIWLAEFYYIPEVIIGLTIVALGTSLPELATSMVAAFRKHSDISLGNIVGSNIFNVLFIMGGVSVFKPLKVNETRVNPNGILTEYFPHFEYLFMLGLSIVLMVLLLRNRIGRLAGVIFLGSYVFFYFYLYQNL
ncbi:MAG: calcium/sodium antiporter [Candidatus Marinimicrobia bacterium]|nr:calcium/sodium antiporter [Candidatus Neomarinimicrobiota bacterium]MCF7839194.1 calcium/sodium antiporter [Candidatus Neomarinimicrobiota bacterium]MCF7902375.1 calcium/sodium antiporter [Candidatus Neomarinimicrobiota bacterium]